MKNATALIETRSRVEHMGKDPQERNRLWWENMPMTYADWEAADRRLESREDYERYVEKYRTCSRYVSSFPFASFAGKKVLEIGCGYGAASCLFARSGAEVTAVDLTAAAVAGAKSTAAALNLHIDVRQMDAQQLGFEDASFDYVFSWGVLHHTHHSESAFRESSRVLRPGGGGLIMVYNRHSWRYFIIGIHHLFRRGLLWQGETWKSVQRFHTDGFYHRHFSPSELRQRLEESGLSVHKVEPTYMDEQMFYKWPRTFDYWLHNKIGWLLVAEFTKR